MPLSRVEVPVAYAMMELAATLPDSGHSPFEKFCCTWVAFNAIYYHVALQGSSNAPPIPAPTRPVKKRRIGSVEIPVVSIIGESQQIKRAVAALSTVSKDQVIRHPATRFFVYRRPVWNGVAQQADPDGYLINGVLNVAYTKAARRPVWAPIDVQTYERYLGSKSLRSDLSNLTEQVLMVLYMVRNNTFHGGKEPGDQNDRSVVSYARLLLDLVVRAFLLPL